MYLDWQWDLTTDLKEILFTANFTKNGELLYETVTYGGFVGLHTGMKTNVMTLTVDTRFDNNYDNIQFGKLRIADPQPVFSICHYI